MPRCWKCGKRGFFLKLRYDGLCPSCAFLDDSEKKAKRNEIRIQAENKRNARIREFRKEFPLTRFNESTQEFFDFWSDVNFDGDVEIWKQKHSLHGAIPLVINTRLNFALFIDYCYSNAEIYDTNLVSCTCDEHIKYNKPCRHMYKLFYELNHTSSNSKIIDIAYPLIDSFCNLSQKAKEEFIFFSRYYAPDGRDLFCNKEINELIDAGMLIRTVLPDYTHLLEKMTKDEIILALAKKSITGYRPSWTKVKLINWVCENQSDFLQKHFRDYGRLKISPTFQTWAEGIHDNITSHKSMPINYYIET